MNKLFFLSMTVVFLIMGCSKDTENNQESDPALAYDITIYIKGGGFDNAKDSYEVRVELLDKTEQEIGTDITKSGALETGKYDAVYLRVFPYGNRIGSMKLSGQERKFSLSLYRNNSVVLTKTITTSAKCYLKLPLRENGKHHLFEDVKIELDNMDYVTDVNTLAREINIDLSLPVKKIKTLY